MTAGQLRRLMHNLDDDDEVQFTATVKANEVHTTPKTTLFEVVLRGNKFKLDDTPSTSFSVRLSDRKGPLAAQAALNKKVNCWDT